MNLRHVTCILPQFDGEGNAIEKRIQLKNPQKENPKVFKHLSKEVPEQAHVGGEIRYLETEEKNISKWDGLPYLVLTQTIPDIQAHIADSLGGLISVEPRVMR